MKKTSKALLTLLCVALLVVGSAMGTLAYLTDTSSVENTFTVGKVYITIDEKDWDDSTPNADRDTENKYDLIPGRTVDKDPTVTVVEESEKAYVRMLVTVVNYRDLKAAFPATKKNEAGELIYQNWYSDGNLLLQYLVAGWDNTKWETTRVIEVDSDADTATYEFRYHEIVDASGAAKKLEPLFTQVVVPGTVEAEELPHLADVEINVVAHAIQAEGFSNAEQAWKAFDAENNN